MGVPKTVRFDEELEPKISEYLDKNNLKLNRLVNIAVKKFISEINTIELEPVEIEEWNQVIGKAYNTHKKAMDELK